MTSIEGSAFKGCKGLTNISVAEGNNMYDSREDCNAVIETKTNKLIAGCMNSVIPNSVTSIGSYAFYGCTGLTSIDIPESVTSIHCTAFNGCKGLMNISVAEGNNMYDSREDCNAIIETKTNKLIAGCMNSVIPNSVTSISSNAFYGCTGLTSIEIPNSVTNIGMEAFYGCTGLTSIDIPASVTRIGFEVFAGCTGLTNISVAEGNNMYDSRKDCNAIIETKTNKLIAGCMNSVIPNSVTSIDSYAFDGCTGLTSIDIPESVTSIDCTAFNGCKGLMNISVAEGNNMYDSREDCNAIIETKTYALIAGCMNSVIPNSVTSISSNAFDGCTGLTSIEIPNSVTNIEFQAFYGCI